MLSVFVSKKFKKEALVKPQRRYKCKPSGFQYSVVREVVAYLNKNRAKKRESVYKTLEERWGLRVESKRFRMSGGVGTHYWMPKLRCYRIQVGASRISTKKPCYRYAPCVDIFDYET